MSSWSNKLILHCSLRHRRRDWHYKMFVDFSSWWIDFLFKIFWENWLWWKIWRSVDLFNNCLDRWNICNHNRSNPITFDIFELFIWHCSFRWYLDRHHTSLLLRNLLNRLLLMMHNSNVGLHRRYSSTSMCSDLTFSQDDGFFRSAREG